MKRNVMRLIAAFMLALLLLPAPSAQAMTRLSGLGEGYEIIIDDRIDLLSDDEEARLAEVMRPISRYGTVVFYTVRESFGMEETRAREYLSANVSPNTRFSSTMFMINMGSRQLTIHSRGALLDTIGTSNAYSITNNVASKATSARYYDCAEAAFQQIYSVLQGNHVPSPMRWICSVLLALALALMLAWRIAHGRRPEPLTPPQMSAMAVSAAIAAGIAGEKLVGQKKTRRSSDSGSGCGGGGCGGGGGGSSCGGGGSSGF